MGGGRTGKEAGRFRWIVSPRGRASFLKVQMRARSVAACFDQIIEEALVLRGHHVGGEARVELLAARLARNGIDLLDRLDEVVELGRDNSADAVAQDFRHR